MRPQGLTLKSIDMYTKSVTVRLDKALVDRLDAIARDRNYPNRSFVIDRALTYALDNPPTGGILNYRGKTPGVLQSAANNTQN